MVTLDCYDHRVLTTEQLRRLHFGSARIAQRRLCELRDLRVIDHFRPVWQRGEGSSPYHWVLDQAGVAVVAALLDIAVDQLSWRRDQIHQIAQSVKLTHQREVNDFFTLLAVEARRERGALVEWWGERRTAAAFAGRVQPDGYGHLQIASSSIRFLLELDRGTEPHRRLAEKADRYTRELPLSALANEQPLVLLLTPTPQRSATAADTVSGRHPSIHVATWSPTDAATPLELIRAAAAQRHAPTHT